jgi:hypothetical protein
MLVKNLEKYVKVSTFHETHYLVAGAASDNTAKNTGTVDRLGYSSAMVYVFWRALAVTDTATLAITVTREQSADGSNWDAAETLVNAETIFTAANPTLAGKGVKEIAQDLSGCKRYVRYAVTANLSAANTDTAAYSVVCQLGGSDVLPAA